MKNVFTKSLSVFIAIMLLLQLMINPVAFATDSEETVVATGKYTTADSLPAIYGAGVSVEDFECEALPTDVYVNTANIAYDKLYLSNNFNSKFKRNTDTSYIAKGQNSLNVKIQNNASFEYFIDMSAYQSQVAKTSDLALWVNLPAGEVNENQGIKFGFATNKNVYQAYSVVLSDMEVTYYFPDGTKVVKSGQNGIYPYDKTGAITTTGFTGYVSFSIDGVDLNANPYLKVSAVSSSYWSGYLHASDKLYFDDFRLLNADWFVPYSVQDFESFTTDTAVVNNAGGKIWSNGYNSPEFAFINTGEAQASTALRVKATKWGDFSFNVKVASTTTHNEIGFYLSIPSFTSWRGTPKITLSFAANYYSTDTTAYEGAVYTYYFEDGSTLVKYGDDGIYPYDNSGNITANGFTGYVSVYCGDTLSTNPYLAITVSDKGQAPLTNSSGYLYFDDFRPCYPDSVITENYALNVSDNVVIDGARLNASGIDALSLVGSGTATFSNNTVSSTNSAVSVSKSVNAIIRSGTYSGGTYSVYSSGGAVRILGGNFSGAVAAEGTDAKIEIIEGTFDTDISQYVVESSKIECVDGIYTVTDTSSKASLSPDAGTYYKINDILEKVPATLEAKVRISSTYTANVGTVLSNYNGTAAAGIYKLDVVAGGKPRIYLVDTSCNEITHTFATDIRTDWWVHIAVTLDEVANTVSLYVDGELAETASLADFDLFELDSSIYVGTDSNLKLSGSDPFFEGSIKTLTLYSDVRTSEEISADMDSVSYEDLALLADYTFTDCYGMHIDNGCGEKYNLKNMGWLKEDQIEPLDDYAYSFAVIGDTQKVTYYYPDDFTKIYDWIIENAPDDKENIEFVLGLGDITDLDSASEWEVASAGIKKLHGVIPYSLIRGNHEWKDTYQSYLSFYEEQVDGTYDGILNTYQTFTVGQMDYLVLTLDVLPQYSGNISGIMNWACGVIESHPNHNVIITTHYNMDTKYISDTNVWEQLASKYENVVLVLSGHYVSKNVLYKQTTGTNGNTVTEMLVDPQGLDMITGVAPTGMITMLYFSADGKNVQVRQYSPIKNMYYSPDSQYTITLDTVDYIYGDANDDAAVDIRDLVRINKALSATETKYNSRTADVNIDGTVDKNDLTALRNKILGTAS